MTVELLKVQKTASGRAASLQENAYDQESIRILGYCKNISEEKSE